MTQSSGPVRPSRAGAADKADATDGTDGIDGLPSLSALQRLIAHFELPVFVFDLTTRQGLFGNEAAASLLRTTRRALQEMLRSDLAGLASPEEAGRIRQGLDALISGAVRSYRGERTFSDGQGHPVHAQDAVMRLDLCDATPVALGVVTRWDDTEHTNESATAESFAPVLATLDHEWRVDSVGPAVNGTLGMCPRQLLGERLLEHVHPDDAPALTAALNQDPEEAAVPRVVRLRANAGWRAVEVLSGPLCDHRPHRVGVLMGAYGGTGTQAPSGTVTGERGVALPELQLTSQQQHVVTRLLRGENIATMAAAMHLSRSTIRNHLWAVYTKAGVHSQSELIAHVTGRHAGGVPDPAD